jgi:hypothetical protein
MAIAVWVKEAKVANRLVVKSVNPRYPYQAESATDVTPSAGAEVFPEK